VPVNNFWISGSIAAAVGPVAIEHPRAVHIAGSNVMLASPSVVLPSYQLHVSKTVKPPASSVTGGCPGSFCAAPLTVAAASNQDP